jgi:NAD kinase
MSSIGILYNSNSDTAGSLANDVYYWLEEQGYDVWSFSTDGLEGPAEQVDGSSLLIVLGGDGTTLLAARLAASTEEEMIR